MAIKKHKPTSPGRRFATWLQHEAVTRSEPEKSLTEGLPKSGGRNKHGRVTSRHRGGGAKRRYRKIDFKRRKDDVPAKVAAIEYDPNRSAHIALLHYADGEKRYILAPARIKLGDTVMSGAKADIAPGNCLPLSAIPTGTTVHNVELLPGRGGQLGRSAGTAIQLVAKEGKHATLRLPSGEMRIVPVECRERRARAGRAGQGRSSASPRQAAADARGGHEPGGSPARRWRGTPHAGWPSGHALGRAHARLPDAEEEEGVRPVHRPREATRQEGEAIGRCPGLRRRARSSRSDSCGASSR
jgi:large subunit ribosomal protein L2